MTAQPVNRWFHEGVEYTDHRLPNGCIVTRALLPLPLADGHPVHAEGKGDVDFGDPTLERGQSNALRIGEGFVGRRPGVSEGLRGFGELLDDLGDDERGSGREGPHRGGDLGVVSGDHDAASLLGDVVPGGVDVHGPDVVPGVFGVGVVGHSGPMRVAAHVEQYTRLNVDLSTELGLSEVDLNNLITPMEEM